MSKLTPSRWLVGLCGICLPLLWFSRLEISADGPERPGIRPVGREGQVLNLGLETGDLRDWQAEGAAFEKQPVRGDTVALRRGDMKSRHAGEFWIGTYEANGDDAQGTLTSAPFRVTHPFGSFLAAGGPWARTHVALVRVDTGEAFFQVSGDETEELRPVVVDLRAHLGKEIFIRIVDRQAGHWGHINYDDFRFHAEKPRFANAIDLEARAAGAPMEADSVKYAGLSPEAAAREITLPPGFSARLFAGEPDVKQPIAFALDDRGRVWVAEGYTYPKRAPEGEGKDRILIFEDVDGDGRFDKRTVFMEKLNLVSGLEIGFGGVWVGAAPFLMFIPDRDGDDQPDGAPEVLLDGWDFVRDTHETLNTFTWGPDGWLYGCHGVFCPSFVGKPGTPKEERQRVDAAVWRYHPTKHQFEVFAEGTSNPWGIDFDEKGQCIIEACVIPHLWHMIQGGRYQRQGGQHYNINLEEQRAHARYHQDPAQHHVHPFIYDDLKTIADHVHYAGNKGPHAGNNRSDAAGGGHAHAGLMVYLGDSWPEEYRGKVFMNNIHGQRLNMDVLERRGSGYAGRHGPDFLNFNDTWSQALNMLYDQDGSVYVIDWYDKNQCHHNDVNGHDRANGRIFKIVYGNTPVTRVNAAKLSDDELVEWQLHKNEWKARHARRVLQERGGNPRVHAQLRRILEENPDPARKLRALWALHATGGLDEGLALAQSRNADEYVRAWAVQLLAESASPSLPPSQTILGRFEELARRDPSAVVRLYLLSAAQRIPARARWELLRALHGRSEDAGDHNIPLMAWFATEPLVAADAAAGLDLAAASRLPRILNFATRRAAALGTAAAYHAITRKLAQLEDDAARLEMLSGLSMALKGQRNAAMPEGWAAVEASLGASANAEIRALTQSLSLTFGSAAALASLKRTMMDPAAEESARRTALESILSVKDPGAVPLMQRLLSDPELRGAAVRGLAAFEDAATPGAILAVYPGLNANEKRDALNTLASRGAFAAPMLGAVAQGTVSAKDLTADLIRQLRNLGSSEVDRLLARVWGVARESTADKKKEIERYKAVYRAGGSQPGDASRGRVVFARACAQCHGLFDPGGAVGPDLTGSNRSDLDYILQNMVDPNAVIPNEYRTSTLETRDERVITGIVKKQDNNSVTIMTANETLVLPRSEIRSLRQSEISMMPEGLLDALKEQELRDLIYYLSRPGQAPFPPDYSGDGGAESGPGPVKSGR